MEKKRPFNLPDKEYQYWKPFRCDNRVYSFDHLNAKELIFNNPYKSDIYRIYATISHHVFTVSINANRNQSLDGIYSEKPTDKRLFSEQRYKLSFYLPQILDTLPNQFCYHGGYKKYCICQLKDENGSDIFYQVVFKVWKVPR